MKRSALFLTLALAVLLVSGCKTLSERKMEKNLTNTLTSYQAAIRWGMPGEAYNFLEPELNAKATAINDPELQNVRVTRYQVLRPAAEVAKNQAVQTVAIQYVFVDRQVQKSLIDNQTWRYHEDIKKWLRSNPIPPYK